MRYVMVLLLMLYTNVSIARNSDSTCGAYVKSIKYTDLTKSYIYLSLSDKYGKSIFGSNPYGFRLGIDRSNGYFNIVRAAFNANSEFCLNWSYYENYWDITKVTWPAT